MTENLTSTNPEYRPIIDAPLKPPNINIVDTKIDGINSMSIIFQSNGLIFTLFNDGNEKGVSIDYMPDDVKFLEEGDNYNSLANKSLLLLTQGILDFHELIQYINHPEIELGDNFILELIAINSTPQDEFIDMRKLSSTELIKYFNDILDPSMNVVFKTHTRLAYLLHKIGFDFDTSIDRHDINQKYQYTGQLGEIMNILAEKLKIVININSRLKDRYKVK